MSSTEKKLKEQLSELLTTEVEYINKLANIVEGYLAEFRSETPMVSVPEDLQNCKGSLVFGNIEDIYYWHKDYFLKALQKDPNSPSALGKAFVSGSSQFHLYAKYSNQKAMSDYIVNEHIQYFSKVQKRLGHKLTISDYLIEPVQRLPRYKIMLTGIAESLKKLKLDCENIDQATVLIQGVLKNVNEFTAVQGIINYSGDISDQGPLIYHAFLTCKYNAKKKRHYVFLFKRSLIFTDRQNVKGPHANPKYTYRHEVPMNKIQLKVLSNERFLLKSAYPNCEDVNIVCYAETEKLHKDWLNEIKQQLRLQENLIWNLVNPSPCEEKEVLM